MSESEPFLKVYSKLTLKPAEVMAALGSDLAARAEVAPPIQFGDLRKDVARGIAVVLIVDGKFFQNFAIPPSEIVDGLRAGVRIYGSSSMGALRAAEVEPHGMIGCGAIYEMVRKTPYFRDDFLGQVFEEATGNAFSTPWIDTYFNLQALRERGELSAEDASLLARIGAEIHFAERTAASYKDALRRVSPERADLVAAIDSAFDPKLGSQKHRDALEAIETIKRDLERTAAQNSGMASRASSARFDLSLFYT